MNFQSADRHDKNLRSPSACPSCLLCLSFWHGGPAVCLVVHCLPEGQCIHLVVHCPGGPSVCPSCSSVCLLSYQYVCQPVRLPALLSICLPVGPFVCLISICLHDGPSVRLLSFCLAVSLFAWYLCICLLAVHLFASCSLACRMSAWQSVCLKGGPYICLAVHISARQSVCFLAVHLPSL